MISINVTGLDSLERQLKAMGDEAVKVLRDAGERRWSRCWKT